MNQHRGSNRRRGRGGSRQPGGQQANRIDSRARGNAPQLLDKYKKLAHDAAMNGDRVQSEYYLQFADHYFRVIADSKALKEEARAKREAERGQSGSDEGDADEEPGPRKEKRQSRSRKTDGDEGETGSEGEEGREDSERKPKRSRGTSKGGRRDDGDGGDEEAGGLDPSALPPAIGSEGEIGESEKPKRKRRASRDDDDDGALEAVG